MGEALMRRYNPFGLRNQQGLPYEFSDNQDAYLTVLIKLLTYFRRGYMEMQLCISMLYPHLKWRECKECVKKIEPLGIEPIMMINWSSHDPKPCEKIMIALHYLCGTSFDKSSYLTAWSLFQNQKELIKLKEDEKK